MEKYNNKFENGISKLRLENCKLKWVPSWLMKDKLIAFNLREVYLSKNNISVLDNIIFTLPNLTHLDLS